MAIRSVNYNINSSYGAYVQRLTPETAAKLRRLGISFTERTTESEAQALIRTYEQKKAKNTSDNSNLHNSNNTPQDELLERARKLADKLGIAIDKKLELKQILTLIENVLEEKIMANKGNASALMELKSFSDELSFIQAQSNGSSGYDNNNQALMMSLELLSEYNKNFLYK